MNWQYLKYFVAVAQEEHFTRAAAKLYISQPALSKAMDNLEKEIGVPLFMKQGRNVILTPFGKILKEKAIRATQLIDEAVEEISAMVDSDHGLVSVSSIFTLGANFVTPIIKEYTKLYNKTQISYSQKTTSDIINDVITGKIDIGFCGNFNYNEFLMDIERTLVLTEDLYVVVPEGHRLAACESVNFRDILDETFIGWNASTGIILSINNALKNAGITTKLKYSISATEDNTVAEMVRQGFGIALLADVPSINMNGLSRVAISDVRISREIYMVWKKNQLLTPSVQSFMDFVITEYCK